MKQLFTDFRKLNYKDKSYFLIMENDIFEVCPLSTKMEQLQNFTGTFYFGFYNISPDPQCVGSQLRNYITFILLNW